MNELDPTGIPQVTPTQGGTDREGAIAKADLYKLANYAHKLFKELDDNDQLEGWVQAKITKAADYIASVYHYLEYEMKFSEYGKHLDNAETLSEDQKMKMKELLAEAKSKVKDIKKAQADKQKGKVEEGIMSGGEQPCAECGGTGVVVKPGVQPSDRAKRLAHKHNVATRAYAAAAKRIDANKNGIPDDEEMEEEFSSTGGTITRPKPGVTRHTHNPGRFSDEPHAEPPSKTKEKSAAERDVDRAADSEEEARGHDWERRFGKGSVTRHKPSDKSRNAKADAEFDRDEKKAKKEKPVDEMFGQGIYEGGKKAKKDYDGDGKVESEKDEVWGSRMKAAKKSGKMEEGKPSAGLSKEKKSAVVKKAKAGGDIGKPGKSFKDVAKKAGGGEKGEKIAAAAMWKNIKETTAYIAEKSKASKPDFADLDKDGDEKEPMKQAAKQAKKETVKESTDFTRMQDQLARLNRSESHVLKEGSEADQIRALTKKLLG